MLNTLYCQINNYLNQHLKNKLNNTQFGTTDNKRLKYDITIEQINYFKVVK